MKIRKGDRVIVLAGKDKGKEGLVLQAIPKQDKVVVEGVNRVKRHRKPTQAMQQGGIIEFEKPIHVSNVALVEDGKPTRVGYKFEGGKKVRISRRTGAEI
ncbi:MAG: 50S ribosomal protein L24 [Microthrixaceae bacterium]|nr:50S ribosomal protein L24 [Microthrixaceae bacterium]MCO5314337.1 50S ribosomal protein L24 [Microthrixaceae bacterium]